MSELMTTTYSMWRLLPLQNYDPAPLADEPKEERGAEVDDIVTWTNSHGARMIGIFGREITQGDAIILMRRAEVQRRIEEAALAEKGGKGAIQAGR